jgi:hypothetical protein
VRATSSRNAGSAGGVVRRLDAVAAVEPHLLDPRHRRQIEVPIHARFASRTDVRRRSRSTPPATASPGATVGAPCAPSGAHRGGEEAGPSDAGADVMPASSRQVGTTSTKHGPGTTVPAGNRRAHQERTWTSSWKR